jgi:hypothetical protein
VTYSPNGYARVRQPLYKPRFAQQQAERAWERQPLAQVPPRPIAIRRRERRERRRGR